MNKNDKDFEAAVIDLRRGNKKSLLYFLCAVLLVIISVSLIGMLVFSISDAVRMAVNV